MGAPVAPEAPVDLNLLRDWSEWQLVARSVEEAEPGGTVLVDGDLQPDWRIPARWLADLLARAAERQVCLAGVIKHSSLARGGAPLVSQLELEAGAAMGPRACWWAPVAVRRAEVGPGCWLWWRASTPTPGSPSGSTYPAVRTRRGSSANCAR